MKAMMIGAGLTVLLALFAASFRMPHSDSHARADEQKGKTMPWKTPQSLKTEHGELHAQLAKATQVGGKTGEASRAVAKLQHPHFEKEEISIQ